TLDLGGLLARAARGARLPAPAFRTLFVVTRLRLVLERLRRILHLFLEVSQLPLELVLVHDAFLRPPSESGHALLAVNADSRPVTPRARGGDTGPTGGRPSGREGRRAPASNELARVL